MLESISHYLAESWFADSALSVLFISGFLSATLLPGGSEAGLIATLTLHQYSSTIVILVATLGNTLGGLTNYWLGILLPNKTNNEKQSHKAIRWLQRYGAWSLLLSWLPLIGDPLCLAAGWLRLNFWCCAILIALGKALRYTLLTAIFYGFF